MNFHQVTIPRACHRARPPCPVGQSPSTLGAKGIRAFVTTNTPSPTAHPEMIARLREAIAETGTITFARYMAIALYDPECGYYQAEPRRPGRPGDFLTSPELHPFFGITLTRHVHDAWERLNRLSPFTVLEYGSGIGGLAWDIIGGLLDHVPEIKPHLRYRLNETNPHRMSQAMTAMAEAGLADIVTPDDGTPITGIVIANEVADAMPVHRLTWNGQSFTETHVRWSDDTGLMDVEGPLSPEVLAFNPNATLKAEGVDLAALPAGSHLEVSPAAAAWMTEVGRRIDRGYALVIDYGYPAPILYAEHRLEGTVRAYQSHTVTDSPYLASGQQDLTAHVDFSLLARAGEGAGMRSMGVTTQADFLALAGLGDHLVRLQTQPGIAVDEYYRAQAAVFRLIDPGGLGRFRILGMAQNAPITPPLAGFGPIDLPASLHPLDADQPREDPMTAAPDGFHSRVFLCGANMEPAAIRARWPEAQFVALARADGVLTQGIGLPANAFGPDIWGIVVETGTRQRGSYLPLTLRDGTDATAIMADDAAALGSLKDILAQARYWELPEAYRNQIEVAITANTPA